MGLNCSCFVVASYCILTRCGTSNTLPCLVEEMSMYEYAGLVDADLTRKGTHLPKCSDEIIGYWLTILPLFSCNKIFAFGK